MPSRTPYYVPACDPDSELYGTAYDETVDEARREIDWTDRANVWSSEDSQHQGWHFPCFDVDFPELHEGHSRTLDAMFPNHRRVPSSTPGHFHLYHDTPIAWDVYEILLNALVELGIVEAGYRNASVARKATFVRMPNVKKVRQ